MVLNATFSNISVISWLSVLFLEETRVPVKIPLTCRKLHNIVLNTPRQERDLNSQL